MRKQPSRYKRRPKGQVREVFNTRYHLKTQTKLPLMRTTGYNMTSRPFSLLRFHWRQHAPAKHPHLLHAYCQEDMSKKFMETTSCIEERKAPEYGHVTYVLATIAIYFCTLHFALCSHAQSKTKQNKTKQKKVHKLSQSRSQDHWICPDLQRQKGFL